MNTVILILIAVTGYVIAYRFYGKFLSAKIFKLSDANKVPSELNNDGVDHVPTRKSILFGHHFTTIAGLGPIVGPAIGIIWGWLPAFLWVFFGAIFMGAVHDFATLVISSRSGGKTIGHLTGDLIGSSSKRAFQVIIQFLLWVVLAVFAMIVGILLNMYPEAVIPVWFQLPIAVWLGYMIRKGKNELLYSIIAVVLLYASILIGIKLPIDIFPILGSKVVSWSIILYVYVFFASTVPVHKLLQPRDYINSHQLLVAIALLVVGLFVAHPVIAAPAFNLSSHHPDSDLPSLMPLLFITIACGAISGFHSLASSGTTVKQLAKESDATFIGYGSMIWESFLAVIVLMAIAGGLTMGYEDDGVVYKGIEAYRHHYSSWTQASGLDAKLNAFIIGGSNLLAEIGIPVGFGRAMLAVFIVSFANTTLDSATRIQRLAMQELFIDKSDNIRKPFNNRYFSTAVVVVLAAILTFFKGDAKGALSLWPLFGSLNQLLAALGLGVVTVWLMLKKKNYIIALIPMIIILVMTLWAMIENIVMYWNSDKYLLLGISVVILILTAWLLVSGVSSLVKQKK